MKMVFTMEKFKSLIVMLSKLHDDGKAASTSTESLPLSKTIKINQIVFLHFLVAVVRVFACENENEKRKENDLKKMTSACNTENNQLFFLVGLNI